MAVFDFKGKLMHQPLDTADYKLFSHATMAWNDQGYLQGAYMVGSILAVVSSRLTYAKLYRGGQEIFKSNYTPLNKYIQGWVTGGRGAILCGKSVIFITEEGKAVSMSMNEKVIDQGMPIETVIHHQDLMTDIWSDGSVLYCLSSAGHIDIVKYRLANSQAIRSSDMHIAAFNESKTLSQNHRAVALTGTRGYLAAATYDRETIKSNTLWLMDRRGKILSKANDCGESKDGTAQTIHRMEFCVVNKHLYLFTQQLFCISTLFLINPRRRASIHFINSFNIMDSGVSWQLIAIPANRHKLISGCSDKYACMVTITQKRD